MKLKFVAIYKQKMATELQVKQVDKDCEKMLVSIQEIIDEKNIPLLKISYIFKLVSEYLRSWEKFNPDENTCDI